MFREFILRISKSLQVFTALDVGEILFARNPGKYKNAHSARVQAQKALNDLVALKQLEKHEGFYRIPTCRSKSGEHAQLLTQHLVEILKITDATVHREHTVTAIGTRPDSLVFISHENKGLCAVLEVVHNETQEYLKNKVSAWQCWPEATRYLSTLFNHKIPNFSIVIGGELSQFPECIPFDDFIAEVKHEIHGN